MTQHVKVLIEQTFEELVLKSAKPAVVDFWAPWCGPCKAFAPTFESYAEKLSGKAAFFKMNVDENKATPDRYNVASIPTVILFRNGKEESRAIGALKAKNLFESLLEE